MIVKVIMNILTQATNATEVIIYMLNNQKVKDWRGRGGKRRHPSNPGLSKEERHAYLGLVVQGCNPSLWSLRC